MSNQEWIYNKLGEHLLADAARSPEDATLWEFWCAFSKTIVQKIADNWEETRRTYSKTRQQHYFSAEFLVGRSTLNNLINLGLYDDAKAALKAYGKDINDVLEEERDAALGNGGLGRLAACFLDSCASQDFPVTGYGILYRYGLFRQEFQDGFQKEYPDSWMEKGYPFLIRRDDEKVLVHYQDFDVYAVPYDLPITGFGTKNVNTLRLWKAEPAEEFDFNLFNSQRFDDAVRQRNRVQDICRVLYPNDTTYDGKVLRVRQQYFFVSASLKHILRDYTKKYGNDMSHFAELHCFQLNDTHPVIAIPELMRLLMSEHSCSWDEAFDICCKCFAYTNHTIMAEALEKWDIGIFQFLVPDVLKLVYEINDKFRYELAQRGVYHETIDYMAPVGDGKVRMAWLACYMGYSINGVAALHTQILKDDTLKDWYKLWPEKFNNKTNGVTPRRWLRMCNPELSALLTEKMGNEDWVRHLSDLEVLSKYEDDKETLQCVLEIKHKNKERATKFIKDHTGIEVNPNAIFDIQIKRLHEYKRQLLNALYILDLYFRVKENPAALVTPRVFIFGAKAAPGYARAKAIIKFINEIARVVNNDPEIGDKMKVVFLSNYNVSMAETLFPAADISEQISTAGLEASGTGNMKFMMNGAVTLGTLDGANVEILEEVGDDNAYIFGVRVEDMPATKAYYNPRWQYENIEGLKPALDSLVNGFLNDNHTGLFRELFNSILDGSSWDPADVYYVLGDFAHYREVRDLVAKDYQDRLAWAKKCWINIYKSGKFSSDRTIRDYSEDIWKIKETPIES